MSAKTDTVHLRISPEMKAELQRQATEEGRTLSNMIVRALEKYVADTQGQKTLKKAKKGP